MFEVLHVLQLRLVDLGRERWGRGQGLLPGRGGPAACPHRSGTRLDPSSLVWGKYHPLGQSPGTCHPCCPPQDSNEEQTLSNPTTNNSTSRKTQTKPRCRRGFFISQRDFPAGNVFLKTRQGLPHFSPIWAPVLILAILVTKYLNVPLP